MKTIVKLIKMLFTFALGTATGYYIGGKKMNGKVIEENKRVNKFKYYYNLLNQWLILKHEGKSLEEYFINHGYQKIAIYGMGEMGNRLYEELKDSDITVEYAIDQNACSTYSEIEVYEMGDNFDTNVDAVIVTAVFAFHEIEQELSQLFSCPIISLEQVVFDI